MANNTTPLRSVREARRVGLRQEARDLKIDPSRLSKIERALVRPNLTELHRIAQYLDFPWARDIEPYLVHRKDA